nr:MAG TPA: hypothetical protein [Caudoviricetes sp.]
MHSYALGCITMHTLVFLGFLSVLYLLFTISSLVFTVSFLVFTFSLLFACITMHPCPSLNCPDIYATPLSATFIPLPRPTYYPPPQTRLKRSLDPLNAVLHLNLPSPPMPCLRE